MAPTNHWTADIADITAVKLAEFATSAKSVVNMSALALARYTLGQSLLTHRSRFANDLPSPVQRPAGLGVHGRWYVQNDFSCRNHLVNRNCYNSLRRRTQD
jgi:hypothetical protein